MRLFKSFDTLMLIVLMGLILIVCLVSGTGKICGEIEVRNSPDEFETKLQNCTIVTGSLSINLIERYRDHDLSKIRFPELR